MHDAPPPPLDRQGIGRLCRPASAVWLSACRHHTQRRRAPGGYAGFCGFLHKAGPNVRSGESRPIGCALNRDEF